MRRTGGTRRREKKIRKELQSTNQAGARGAGIKQDLAVVAVIVDSAGAGVAHERVVGAGAAVLEGEGKKTE